LEDRGFNADEDIGFSIYLSLPAALGPGVYSVSYRNRNEYPKQKKRFWGVESGRRIRLLMTLEFRFT
jgi:hypothetical protein